MGLLSDEEKLALASRALITTEDRIVEMVAQAVLRKVAARIAHIAEHETAYDGFELAVLAFAEELEDTDG